jgi:Mg2+ and Co2+ transporter CorA
MRQDYGWKLPGKIVSRLGVSSYGRQRAIFEEDNLLLILHYPPGSKNYKRETAVFWRQPSGAWFCNGLDDGTSKLKKLVKTYEDQITAISQEYGSAETAQDLFEVITKINPMKRAANDMYTAMQSAREQVKGDNELIEMRDRAYEAARFLDLLYEDTQTALNFRIAKNAQDDADAAKQVVSAQHKLNILAAIFFPLTALTSIFGMELPNGLNKLGVLPFWVILFVGIFIGSSFKNWVVKKEEPPKLTRK